MRQKAWQIHEYLAIVRASLLQKLREYPGNRGLAARDLYEKQLKTLDYKLGYAKTVRHGGNAPIYRLIFGSKSRQDPDGQYGLYLGPGV